MWGDRGCLDVVAIGPHGRHVASLLSRGVERDAAARWLSPSVDQAGMGPDLSIIYTPVGGGHKAAAMATAEAARNRGLSVETVDLFELAPRWVARAYLTAHFGGTGVIPRLYGSAYFESNHTG